MRAAPRARSDCVYGAAPGSVIQLSMAFTPKRMEYPDSRNSSVRTNCMHLEAKHTKKNEKKMHPLTVIISTANRKTIVRCSWPPPPGPHVRRSRGRRTPAATASGGGGWWLTLPAPPGQALDEGLPPQQPAALSTHLVDGRRRGWLLGCRLNVVWKDSRAAGGRLPPVLTLTPPPHLLPSIHPTHQQTHPTMN